MEGNSKGRSSASPCAAESAGGAAEQTMVALPAAGAELWKALAGLQEDLFAKTHREAESLAQAKDGLEAELQMWKDSYINMRQRNLELQRQVSHLEERDSLVVVLIDGDGCLFRRELLLQGQEGGAEAARLLRSAVVREMDRRIGKKESPKVLINLFCNKHGLSLTLRSLELCTGPQFEAFCLGFTQAHPLISLVDAGSAKEASDAKIAELLRLYAPMTHCRLAFVGVSHDNSYARLIGSLHTDGHGPKVVLLKGYDEVARELKAMSLDTVQFPEVFITEKLVSGAHPQLNPARAQPVNSTGAPPHAYPSPSATPVHPAAVAPGPASALPHPRGLGPAPTPPGASAAALPKPTQPAPAFARGGPVPPAVRVDTSKPLNKLRPAPCNHFYLRSEGCWKGRECPYSHSYALEPAHLASLRALAKTSPCYVELKGGICTDRHCPLGHVCPFGGGCKFRAGDLCRFKGRWMHPDPNPNSNASSNASSNPDPGAQAAYRIRVARDALERSGRASRLGEGGE